jgi:adenylylsulfate kinase-like enzyme
MNYKVAKKKNVICFDSYVSREDREELYDHKDTVIWVTGLSDAGKSTIAHLAKRNFTIGTARRKSNMGTTSDMVGVGLQH